VSSEFGVARRGFFTTSRARVRRDTRENATSADTSVDHREVYHGNTW
jgi:hypothetical protein